MPLGSLKCTLDGPGGGIEWVRWHPRLHEVLAGSEDGTVLLWNDGSNVYLSMFFGHASSVTCGYFTPDGKTICTGSDDTSLRVWNPKTIGNVHVINGDIIIFSSISSLKAINSLLSHPDSVECIGHSPSHHPFAATGGLDQKLIIWDLERSTARCSCDHEDGVASLAWLGSSRHVVTGVLDAHLNDLNSRGLGDTVGVKSWKYPGWIIIMLDPALKAPNKVLILDRHRCGCKIGER
ncbi:hypothetical protein MKW98_015470 [Papaver atlanticum]|uniref:Uncharacterized protein n=1 Tax=Papaver atlanticum TaxID=357466 RepID=A0AAD4RYY7_9MAGN|nr:hypothetical protein MKW98_015470 [Papaver atlanticum]